MEESRPPRPGSYGLGHAEGARSPTTIVPRLPTESSGLLRRRPRFVAVEVAASAPAIRLDAHQLMVVIQRLVVLVDNVYGNDT
jgi:hypothetical protein